jgi:hypothetical protein
MGKPKLLTEYIIEDETKNEYIEEFKKLKFETPNPVVVGPRVWDMIHKFAKISQSPYSAYKFKQFMGYVCRHFPCVLCQGHCKAFLKAHPIENYIGITMNINRQVVDVGMFYWAWMFHNAVNQRLEKKTMTFENAFELY